MSCGGSKKARGARRATRAAGPAEVVRRVHLGAAVIEADVLWYDACVEEDDNAMDKAVDALTRAVPAYLRAVDRILPNPEGLMSGDKKSKSLLDGVEVADNAFPLSENVHRPGRTAKDLFPVQLQVVGSCPTCGAPIYGRQYVPLDGPAPVQHTCDCRHDKKLAARTT